MNGSMHIKQDTHMRCWWL